MGFETNKRIEGPGGDAWEVLPQGFVSAVKGRETPDHQLVAVFLDGKRVRLAQDAYIAPNGFVLAMGRGGSPAYILDGHVVGLKYVGAGMPVWPPELPAEYGAKAPEESDPCSP